jgi:hypothetical protein
MDTASLGSRGRDADLKAAPCPRVLKITQCVLIGFQNPLLYVILQGLSRMAFLRVLITVDPF